MVRSVFLVFTAIILSYLFPSELHSQYSCFRFDYEGPDTIYVDNKTCLGKLYWGDPTKNPKVKGCEQTKVDTAFLNVIYEQGNFSNKFELCDSVPSGLKLVINYRVFNQFGDSFNLNAFTIVFADSTKPVFDVGQNPSQLTLHCITELEEINVSVSDSCGGPVDLDFEETPKPSFCQGGSFTRTWIATDQSGNQSRFTQSITVVADDDPPIIVNAPQNGSGSCDQVRSDYIQWLDEQRMSFSAIGEGCGLMSLSDNAPDPEDISGDCEEITVTFTALDSCDNEAIVDVHYRIEDEEKPILLSLPKDLTVSCKAANLDDILQNWLDSLGGAEAIDNCSGVTWTTDPEDPTIIGTCNDSLEVKFIATDSCGNKETRIAFFIVQDFKPPHLTQAPRDDTVSCDAGTLVHSRFESWLNNAGFADFTDSCQRAFFFAAVPGTYDLGDPGTYPGSRPEFERDLQCSPEPGTGASIPADFVFYDECGNSIVRNARFFIRDTVPPQLMNCPDDQTFEADPGMCSGSALLPAPEAVDDCEAVFRTLRYTVNTRIQSASPGDPNLPVDTVRLDFQSGVQPEAPLYSMIRLDLNFFKIDANDTSEYFRVFGEDGTLLGRSNNTMSECGNSTTAIFTISAEQIAAWSADSTIRIRLVPNRPPNMPGRQTINDICNGSSVRAELQWRKRIDLPIIYTVRIPGVDTLVTDSLRPYSIRLNPGVYTIEYEIADCSGNRTTCQFLVSMADTQKPEATCPGDVTDFVSADQCIKTRSIPLPAGLKDNCTQLPRLFYEVTGATAIPETALSPPYVPPVIDFEKGFSQFIYIIRDDAGNEKLCNVVVSVSDTIPPKAQCGNTIIEIDPSGLENYILTPEEMDNNSADNCAIASMRVEPNEFDCSDIGTEKEVTLTVTDEDGNESQCTGRVRIQSQVLIPEYELDICTNDTLKLFANTRNYPGPDPLTYFWERVEGTGPTFTSNQKNPVLEDAPQWAKSRSSLRILTHRPSRRIKLNSVTMRSWYCNRPVTRETCDISGLKERRQTEQRWISLNPPVLA